MDNYHIYSRSNLKQIMKVTSIVSVITLLIFFSSCSKKEEIVEGEPKNNLTIQTTSDFLSSNQKGYYFLTDIEGETIHEGVLDNSNTYEIELSEIEEVNLNYLIRTVSGDITYYDGHTFLDIDTNEVFTFHKFLNKQNGKTLTKPSTGSAKVVVDCIDDYETLLFSIFSDYSYSSSLPIRYDDFWDETIDDMKLYSESDNALAILSRINPITAELSMEYQFVDLRNRQRYNLNCQAGNFVSGRDIMKSISVKKGQSQVFAPDTSRIMRMFAFPIDKVISNLPVDNYSYTNTGLIYEELMITYLNEYKFWYPSIWVEGKREHIEMIMDISKENRNGGIEHYIQKHYGNYPPPTDLNLNTPITNAQVRHSGSTSTIFQSGEHYLLQIEYQKRGFIPSDLIIYDWVLNLDSKTTELEWAVPSLSEQAANYFSLDKDFYRNNTIPVMSYFETEEGINYDSYVTTYFTESNPFIFRNMNKWKTTWFTRKSL